MWHTTLIVGKNFCIYLKKSIRYWLFTIEVNCYFGLKSILSAVSLQCFLIWYIDNFHVLEAYDSVLYIGIAKVCRTCSFPYIYFSCLVGKCL